jgi:hypothetical protein
MGRIGEADDVASLAFLLASPVGSFINGQVIGDEVEATRAARTSADRQGPTYAARSN